MVPIFFNVRKTVLYLLFFSAFAASAQKKTQVYYLDYANILASKKHYSYKRVVQPVDSGAIKFKFIETFADGTFKRTGGASTLKPGQFENGAMFRAPELILEGRILEYFRNGNIKVEANYHNDKRIGKTIYYYSNGCVKEVREYLNNRSSKLSAPYQITKIQDSTGRSLLDSSLSGKISLYSDGFVFIGNILKGQKHGLVRQGMPEKKTFTEIIYDHGKFVSGYFLNGDNAKVDLVADNTRAAYIGGNDAFYQFIKDNFKYPRTSLKGDVKGRVYVAFLIKEDGSVANVQAISSLDGYFEEEAVRVVKKTGNWVPFIIDGVPIEALLTVPIVAPGKDVSGLNN